MLEILQLRRTLISFDLETTGTDAKTARILQLSMRCYYPDKPGYEYKTLVNPMVPIPQGSIDTHGITQEIIDRGCARCKKFEEEHPHPECNTWKPVPRFADIAPSLHRGFVDADFSGYNVKNYDLQVMVAEFARCKYLFDFSNAVIIDGHRLWQIIEPRTLTDAVRSWLGEDHTDAHDAMADVIATDRSIRSMLEKNPNLPRDIEELGKLLYPRDPNRIDANGKFIFIEGVPSFNFGKFKGEALDASKDTLKYLQWMIDKGDFTPEVKDIARNVIDGILPVKELN